MAGPERRPGPSQAAIREAGRILAADCRAAGMTPRQQAEAAWTPTAPFHPGGPKSIDELEDRIREERGLPPKDRSRGGEAKPFGE